MLECECVNNEECSNLTSSNVYPHNLTLRKFICQYSMNALQVHLVYFNDVGCIIIFGKSAVSSGYLDFFLEMVEWADFYWLCYFWHNHYISWEKDISLSTLRYRAVLEDWFSRERFQIIRNNIQQERKLTARVNEHTSWKFYLLW